MSRATCPGIAQLSFFAASVEAVRVDACREQSRDPVSPDDETAAVEANPVRGARGGIKKRPEEILATGDMSKGSIARYRPKQIRALRDFFQC